jgi:Flp pilus assembly protein TadD
VTRREFLAASSVAPALAAVATTSVAAADEHTPYEHRAPYEALRQYILPGADQFPEEQTAFSIREALSSALRSGELPLAATASGSSVCPRSFEKITDDVSLARFDAADTDLAEGWRRWVESLGDVRRAHFSVLPDRDGSKAVRGQDWPPHSGYLIRYEIAGTLSGRLFHRVGYWTLAWDAGRITSFAPVSEEITSAAEPWFRDVTEFDAQLARGIPYWRARLDPATGIDIYGSNGIAVGDIDDDGIDEVYVCQPGGLPNKLFKFGPDGKMTDITEPWGVDLLDDTSSALFLDLRNNGRQDLIVLRISGPVLFLHEGNRYRARLDAFDFATAPKGGFTGMAAADFDRDGKVDVYLCCYVYFQSEAQYTYASPYHDARNGPPNFLFRNMLNADGSGVLRDCTAETGMNQNNDRFSFAPAWCDYNGDGWPDLYVANDFGRKNLYRNREGKFTDVAAEAGVEDVGPGMSASWFDLDHDGNPDLYVANMWTGAGQRLVLDPKFEPARKEPEAYIGHTMGNSLFRNKGDGTFADVTMQQHAAFGRWAWAAGGHDFDNDGNAEVLVTCGMLTNSSEVDLESFFWRQVVAQSPVTHAPSSAYENGWNAINQFIREEYSWNGHEPNVFHVRRGDRYFDFSGVSGVDFAEDSRAFAVTDFDNDGRPDILLKSRLGPQLRVLQNNCTGSNNSIAFDLRGTKSNRDAIGARVEVDGRTKWLEAGSGFLSQHSKRILFGLGTATVAKHVRIVWPSGLVQTFSDLKSGCSYQLTEGTQEFTCKPFRAQAKLASLPVKADNQMALHDTWFLEPIPLPTKERGPGLFTVTEATPEYQIFRRYLFDWRTTLKPPLPMLLNEAGEAVKVYAAPPSQEQVAADLADKSPDRGLPFPGAYIKKPKRDFFKFGAAYLWAGYPDRALPYLNKVLEHEPDNARVLVLAGQIHLQTEQFDLAETYFARALQVNSSSVGALLGLGGVAAAKKQETEATSFYERALKVEPKSPEAANGLGLAKATQGQLDLARQYFERAIAGRRNYAEAINNLGVLFARQGKVNDAIAAWRYGIQVAPDDGILYLNLGRTYVQSGDKEKAREVMQQLLDRKPDDPTARRALQELESR